MIQRKMRVVGVAIVAVLAMGVLTAFAQAGVFEAEKYTATVAGSQTTQLAFTGVVGAWKCSTLTMQGTLTEEKSELNLTPSYGKCNWAGIAATINMEGCTYEYVANSTLEGGNVSTSMNVRCPVGKEAKLTLTNGCTIRVPEQTGLNTVTATPTGSGKTRTVDLTFEVTKMNYTVENGALCPNTPADGLYTNGTLAGQVSISAFNAGSEQIGFTVT